MMMSIKSFSNSSLVPDPPPPVHEQPPLLLLPPSLTVAAAQLPAHLPACLPVCVGCRAHADNRARQQVGGGSKDDDDDEHEGSEAYLSVCLTTASPLLVLVVQALARGDDMRSHQGEEAEADSVTVLEEEGTASLTQQQPPMAPHQRMRQQQQPQPQPIAGTTTTRRRRSRREGEKTAAAVIITCRAPSVSQSVGRAAFLGPCRTFGKQQPLTREGGRERGTRLSSAGWLAGCD